MAKHRVSRRKPRVTPIANTDASTLRPKKPAKQHRKSYYKPKTSKIATSTTKAITPLNIKSEVKELNKQRKQQQRLHKKQYQAVRKKSRKLYRELRRQQKLENKTRTKIRTKAKYKVEPTTPPTGSIITPYDEPMIVSWETEARDADMRTVETLDRPPETASDNLFEMISYLDMAVSSLELSPTEGGWNKAGVKKLSEAQEKLQDLLALEKSDPKKFEQIVASLNASKDMSRVKDIVYLQIYEEVATEAQELLDVVEGVLNKLL